jgi:hypothetical protein
MVGEFMSKREWTSIEATSKIARFGIEQSGSVPRIHNDESDLALDWSQATYCLTANQVDFVKAGSSRSRSSLTRVMG